MGSVSGVGLCGWCSWRKQRGCGSQGEPVGTPRAAPRAALLRWVLPGAGGGRVPGRARHPGRLYDLPPALPRPRATGNFQKPYIPRPPWVCEYLYLCVSVEIFRWLFLPRRGVEGPG